MLSRGVYITSVVVTVKRVVEGSHRRDVVGPCCATTAIFSAGFVMFVDVLMGIAAARRINVS